MLDTLYNLLTSIENEPGFIICFVLFILAAWLYPKSDKRTKTGYKNNKEPGTFMGCLLPLIMIISFLVGVFYLIRIVFSHILGG